LNAILQGRVNVTPPVFHQGGRLQARVDNALEESPPPMSPTPLRSPVINRSQTSVDFHWSQTQSLNSTPPARPSPLPPIHPKPLSPFGGSTSSDDLPDPADIEDFTAVLLNRPRSCPQPRPAKPWQGPPAAFAHKVSHSTPSVNTVEPEPVALKPTRTVIELSSDTPPKQSATVVRPAATSSRPYTRPSQSTRTHQGTKRPRDPIEEAFDIPTIMREQRETMLARMEASEKGKKARMESKFALKMELEREKLRIEHEKFKLRAKFRDNFHTRKSVELSDSDE